MTAHLIAPNASSEIRYAIYFRVSGPRFEEILFMGDLLRQDSETSPADAVVKVLMGARAGRIKRRAWQEKVTELYLRAERSAREIADQEADARRREHEVRRVVEEHDGEGDAGGGGQHVE